MKARLTRAVGVLTFAVSALTATAALAEDPAPPAPAGTPLVVRAAHPMELQPEPPVSRLGFKLAAGLVVVGGGLWAWKRRRAAPAAKRRSLTITARKAIGVRSELLVVEIDGHSLLLGVTPGSIQRLAVLPDALGAEALSEDLDGADLDADPGFAMPRAASSTSPELRDRDRDRDRDRERELDRDRDRDRRARAADREPESRSTASMRSDTLSSRRPDPLPSHIEALPPRARVSTPPRKDTSQMERQIRGLLRTGRGS